MFNFEATILPIAQRRPITSLIKLMGLTFYLAVSGIYFKIVKYCFKTHSEDTLAFGKIII